MRHGVARENWRLDVLLTADLPTVAQNREVAGPVSCHVFPRATPPPSLGFAHIQGVEWRREDGHALDDVMVLLLGIVTDSFESNPSSFRISCVPGGAWHVAWLVGVGMIENLLLVFGTEKRQNL